MKFKKCKIDAEEFFVYDLLRTTSNSRYFIGTKHQDFRESNVKSIKYPQELTPKAFLGSFTMQLEPRPLTAPYKKKYK